MGILNQHRGRQKDERIALIRGLIEEAKLRPTGLLGYSAISSKFARKDSTRSASYFVSGETVRAVQPVEIESVKTIVIAQKTILRMLIAQIDAWVTGELFLGQIIDGNHQFTHVERVTGWDRHFDFSSTP